MATTPKILVVDDDDEFAKYLKDWLEGFYPSVLRAADGETGLKMAQEEIPNLILLDMKMPRMNGLEMLQALLDQPKTAQIPVLVLTGSDFDPMTKELIQQQPNVRAFLSKTCGPKTIKEQVDRALSSGNAHG